MTSPQIARISVQLVTDAPTPEFSIDQLEAALEDGAYVLDVRNPDEYEEKRIPGVTLIPLGELESRAAEVPTDQQVWVVCAAGGRSMKAATYLRQLGVDAVNVAGGTNAWAGAGKPVESGS